jgi:hypothetical protein
MAHSAALPSSGFRAVRTKDHCGADAFEDTGDVFDPATASRLRDHVLAAGGSQDPAEACKAFRGRPEARLRRARHRGLTPVQRFRNSNHIALTVGRAKSPGTADVTTPGAMRFCPRGPTKPRVPTAWAKARTALMNAVSRARRLCPTLHMIGFMESVV